MVMPGTERDGLLVQEKARTASLLEDLHQIGITYQSIADDLGVDRRTILRWVKSETHPTPQILTNDYLEKWIDLALQIAEKVDRSELEPA